DLALAQPYFAGFLGLAADLVSVLATAFAAALLAGSLFFGLAGFASAEASSVSLTFFGALPDLVASPSPGESCAGTSSAFADFLAAAFLPLGFSAWSWPQPGPWTCPSSLSRSASTSSRVALRSETSALEKRKSTTLSSYSGARSCAANIGSCW